MVFYRHPEDGSAGISGKSFLMKVFLLSSCAWYVFPLPHHRSHSALHAEQMKLRLFCLWLLQAMLLAKKTSSRPTRGRLGATTRKLAKAGIFWG
jgi:hypothetical protein